MMMAVRKHYENANFINDVVVAEPYETFNQKRNIINQLERRRRKGHRIMGIEVDDNRKCIIYRVPNDYIHNN